jgi:Holliday junction resolvase
MFIEVTDRKGEQVLLNEKEISTVRFTKDDYGNTVILVKMTNNESLYVPVAFSTSFKVCKKK